MRLGGASASGVERGASAALARSPCAERRLPALERPHRRDRGEIAVARADPARRRERGRPGELALVLVVDAPVVDEQALAVEAAVRNVRSCSAL
ncbi:hypothetical protein [Sorangium cellulosum]|uniref:hypothetical protein n=1 Tax=Sorangium cellulosum TaxID=56 RepID=UPI00133133C1|nr:hypothetical protein [Sorangium cellulosum]